jgi:hypothetical protein
MGEKKQYGVRKPSHAPIPKRFTSDDSKVDVNTKNGSLQPGLKIRHKVYGVGIITKVSGNGENEKVEVKFGNLDKKFLIAYTPLEILN